MRIDNPHRDRDSFWQAELTRPLGVEPASRMAYMVCLIRQPFTDTHQTRINRCKKLRICIATPIWAIKSLVPGGTEAAAQLTR